MSDSEVVIYPTYAKFAFVVDGDVGMIIQMPDNPAYIEKERHVACLRSNPVIIEITNKPGVNIGWTYTGQDFIPPVESV